MEQNTYQGSYGGAHNGQYMDYTVDMVFCIDATGSMEDFTGSQKKIINMVKQNALNFYNDFSGVMSAKGKKARQVRVIAFRDYRADGEHAMMVTDFFCLPQQEKEFEACINSIHADGGGDIPEDGLEALAYAIKSKWTNEGAKKRQVIVVWTDAGTHACIQVANFHCSSTMPSGEILSQLRRYLPEDIGIYSCRDVSPRFHARLNAREKTYRYRIWNSQEPCVFQRRFVTVMEEPLDADAMERAAKLLLGEHDFSAFCGNAKMKKSTVRYIRSIRIRREGPELQLTFTGNGFLHNMVRILVGTLVEVGRGQREAASVAELFGGKRSEAGFLAPPQGLCLEEVYY